MLDAPVEFLEMELAWLRTIRKGRRMDLAISAAEREAQVIAELRVLRGKNYGPNFEKEIPPAYIKRPTVNS